ncbi:MAG: hypothetical protein A2817_02430 [Candidatus Yanofskybacteria bacterium RIFCSPHIGHO2_01_FULL_39_8b]|uniref:Uncharacterized protein n=1 Tax=Candidatus Yanofskybacteria bacterium RIFCSPHIGHO2_01_FULL_39_8b TaxID=1802659 RepID=A0A1F8E8W9_9BACT|nr:hypothetical protein [uncultured bacterium]OGM97232.1 MAG: hypothetical protein A2817_02430 [Candidatus Yanofskybacteria bacterium RIFCSPHIGHO2_01_FULL_39_8b]
MGKKFISRQKTSIQPSSTDKTLNGNGNGNGVRKDIQKHTEKMLKVLNQRPTGVEDLSNEIDISKQMVYRVIRELIVRGYRIVRDSVGQFKIADINQHETASSSEFGWRPNIRILVWSGAELGSVGQQGDLLATVYKTIIPEEKPDFVIGLGNIIVGNLSRAHLNETFLTELPSFYKGLGKKPKLHELLYRAEIDYVAKMVGPEILTTFHNCKTHFISGLREQSFIRQGLDDPMKLICKARPEWEYVDLNMHVFRVTNTGEPISILALTSKKKPFRGVYTRGHRPRKTADSIAGWLINRLRNRGIKDYPRVIFWTDGVGVYTSMNDVAGLHFISLPKLAVTDTGELELDTPPNLGVVILDLTFDEKGTLKKYGIECRFRNLAPYVKERGY